MHHQKTAAAAQMTVIYYLLTAGEISAWHRIDAVEIWHYYSGDTLRLELSPDGIEITTRRLGMGDGAELHISGSHRDVAKRPFGWRLDIGRLHGGAGVRVCRLRTRTARLASCQAIVAPCQANVLPRTTLLLT